MPNDSIEENMIFDVINIVWETDGKKVENLPTSASVECWDEEFVADRLSDAYGWLVYDFEIAAVRKLP